MSLLGQSLQIQGVRVMSAIPPIATEFRHCAPTDATVSFWPWLDADFRLKLCGYG